MMVADGNAGSPVAGTGWASVLADRRWAVLVLICGGIWLHAADSLVVATTMPSIIHELGGVAWTGWGLALYEMTSIIAGAVGGSAAVRFGLARALTVAAVIFAAGCLAGALAPDMAVFLAGRSIQGFGGGAMVALCHVAVTRSFPERHWTRVFAIVSVVWGVSALTGPLIGGLFAESGFWRGAYWTFGAQGLLAALVAPFLLPGGRRAARAEPVPWRSLCMLVPGILGIAIAGVLESMPLAVLAVLVGVASLLLFVRFDGREAAPLMPHRSFTVPAVRAGLTMALSLATASVSLAVYGPLLLQRLHGMGPLETGFLLAVESVSWSVAALLVARFSGRRENPWILGGSVIVLGGIVLCGIVVPAGPVWAIVFGAVMLGAGFGFAWSFIARRVVSAAHDDEKERAAGALPTMQMLGYALGAAIVGIIANGIGFTLDGDIDIAQSVGRWIFFGFVPIALPGIHAAWRLAKSAPAATRSSAV
jgi:MFS family permease